MTDAKPRLPPWVPYVVPYVLFLATIPLGSLGTTALFLSYPVRTVLVAAAIFYFWRRGRYPELDLRPSLLAVAVGLLGFALWVLPEDLLAPLPKNGGSDFDPHALGDRFVVPVLAVRTICMVLVVPIFEELFLRSFLLRYLDGLKEDVDDFRTIPIGRFRWFSFLGVAVMMAITHHRWLRAGLYSMLVTLLLYREKRMGGVIWAHAVTNLALAAYVFHTGRWAFL
jgi:CAAX prenyl protease-like protein